MNLIKSPFKKDSKYTMDKKELKQEIAKLEEGKEILKEKTRLKNEQKKEMLSFYAVAYRLLAKRVEFLFPRLISLQPKLKKAAMPVIYEAYVCGLILLSMIGGIIGLVVGTVISISFNMQPPEFGILFPVILGAGLFQGLFAFMSVYPNFNIKSRTNRISVELPYYIGYMATLSASGLGLEGILNALAKEESKEEIVKDAKYVGRNLELLGMDIITAVKDLIERTPPGPYNEMLEGLISAVESGGNLQDYFTATAKVQMEEKKAWLKKMIGSLGIVAEMYTILMIVFPLLSIIMLSIMAIMTPKLAGFDLITLMQLLTFGFVPFFGLMMLVMVDTMVPKR